MANPPNRARILGGVLLVPFILAILTLFGGVGIQRLFGFKHLTVSYLMISRLLYWLFLLVVWLYATRVEGQKLLMWPEQGYNFWTYILSLIAITGAVWMATVVSGVILYLSLHHTESSHLMQQMVKIFRTNLWLVLYTAITAGVTEELIFRGYLLPRLNILLKNPFLAIAISTLIFGLAHIGYGTVINVVVPVIIGLALAFYYWRFQNIKVAILFHALWDLMVILVAIRFH
jgi:membrane protease YdiL (CAAX protease family)